VFSRACAGQSRVRQSKLGRGVDVGRGRILRAAQSQRVGGVLSAGGLFVSADPPDAQFESGGWQKSNQSAALAVAGSRIQEADRLRSPSHEHPSRLVLPAR